MRNNNIWARAATAVLVAGVALVSAVASPAAAQSTLTPEGTVIRNIATVTYTDANNNTYAPAADTVDVTVGFLAGIDITAGAASVNISAGSSNNTITFTIRNLSNGPTGVDLSLANAAPAVATGVSYVYGGNPYATLELLEAAIGTMAQGAEVTVTVEYDAAEGTGGLTDNLELTGTTSRSTAGGSAATDKDDTDIVVTNTGNVSVTPDDGAASNLPSNGTNYVAQFTVTNNQSGTDDFDLSATTTGAAGLIVVRVALCSDTSVAVTSIQLAAGANQSVCVVYTTGDVPAGSQGTVVLEAESDVSSDTGTLTVTVIRPSLQITKQAFLEAVSGSDSTMSATEVGATLVLPGQYIWYRMEVRNVGSSSASTVELTDQLPAEVIYVSHIDDGGSAPAWTYTGANFTANLVKAQLTGIAAPVSPATEVIRWISVRVRIK